MKRVALGVLLVALVAALAWVPGCRSSSSGLQPYPARSTEKSAPQPAAKAGGADADAALAQAEQAAAAAPADASGAEAQLAQAEADAEGSGAQNQAVADGYFEEGRQLLNAYKLKEAKTAFLKALQVNPQHAKAKELLDTVRQNLGEYPESETGSRVRRLIEEAEVRGEQTRVEVENRFQLGVKYIETQDFDKAIEEFTWVIELIKWNPPLDVEFRPRLQQTESYLAKARERKKERDAEVMRKQEEAARQLAEVEEGSRRSQQAKEIDKRYNEALQAMEERDFGRAEDLAEEILRLDPQNVRAERLHVFARSARHAQTDDQTALRWVEEFRNEMHQLDMKIVPTPDTVTFNKEAWPKISQRKERGIAKAAATLSPADEAVRSRMKATKISLNFTDAPLTDIVAFMREFTQLNIIVDSKSIQNPSDIKITLKVDELPFESVLSLIAKMHKLAYKIEDGVVIILNEGDLAKDTVLELYDVQDLTVTIPDFIPGDISLVPATGDTAAGVQVTEAKEQQVTQEDLEKLIKNNIAKGTWETAPNSLTFSGGTLIIRHTTDVHSRIQKFLKEVRASTGMIVSIESRFLTVSKHFLEDVGIDFRGLPNPINGKDTTLSAVPDGIFSGQAAATSGIFKGRGNPITARVENILSQTNRVQDFFARVLDNAGGTTLSYSLLDDTSVEAILRAVRKDERSREVIAPRLTAFNNQRAFIYFARQESYIKDFNVEVAQQAAIAKPIIGVVSDGVTLDVRPTVSADRKYITLELRPTVALLKNLRNIPVNTVGAGIVVVEAPELELQRVKTTITLPDEGTVLVGGVGDILDADTDSSVPFLDKIPVLSFFASHKASAQQRKTLLILIRAKLILMEEEERKLRH